MRRSSIFAVLVLSLIAAPAAQAGWSRPIPLGPAGQQSVVVGLAANGADRPAVLLTCGRSGNAVLSLRRSDARGRLGKALTVASPKNLIEGEGLFAGRGTVAIDPSPGADWQPPIVRGLGASIRRVGLLAPAGNRPALLTMSTASRGVQTATIRDGGDLAASRRPDSGSRRTHTYVAQGAARTWLATSRIVGPDSRPVVEGLLFGSTPS